MTAVAVIDTNVLVHCHDWREPEKQRRARDFVRRGMPDHELVLTWQSLVEFVSVTTTARRGREPLLTIHDARLECEALLTQFPCLFPDERTLDIAIGGQARYDLPWFDAILWAHAEQAEAGTLVSEDFQHGRTYGKVRVVNPFVPEAQP